MKKRFAQQMFISPFKQETHLCVKDEIQLIILPSKPTASCGLQVAIVDLARGSRQMKRV